MDIEKRIVFCNGSQQGKLYKMLKDFCEKKDDYKIPYGGWYMDWNIDARLNEISEKYNSVSKKLEQIENSLSLLLSKHERVEEDLQPNNNDEKLNDLNDYLEGLSLEDLFIFYEDPQKIKVSFIDGFYTRLEVRSKIVDVCREMLTEFYLRKFDKQKTFHENFRKLLTYCRHHPTMPIELLMETLYLTKCESTYLVINKYCNDSTNVNDKYFSQIFNDIFYKMKQLGINDFYGDPIYSESTAWLLLHKPDYYDLSLALHHNILIGNYESYREGIQDDAKY